MDYRLLADRYGTPLYVYDFDYMASQYETLKNSFNGKKSLIAYALKANSNLSVIARFASLGAGADCVSYGEVRRALIAGVPKYKIIFSGVGKLDEEIKGALDEDILFINCESEAELRRVEFIAQTLGKQARISVRVNPAIDAKTHPYISTGLKENKFGVDIATAKRLYIYAKNSERLEPIGIHFHIGSQLTDITPIAEAADKVADLARSLIALDIDLKFFDVGGGIGVTYKDEAAFDLSEYASKIALAIKGLDLTIICEPGRFLTAGGGVFLTRVLYEKHTDAKRFVVVDGAMNDLIRPALYNAYHRIEAIGKSGGENVCDVVGPICESGDFFAKNAPLPPVERGDLLAAHTTGAYGFTMSSNFNSRRRAAEVAVENGEDRLIRERETYDDLLAGEIKLLKADSQPKSRVF
ncbi:MAG: diaminopimelate decarboxylase [Helicobacteraceae bacterium]|jgi:diaminopimelate decarboxylase|nr:diaminopimelate decarboxylase [Helicobacteraceae bacterium]